MVGGESTVEPIKTEINLKAQVAKTSERLFKGDRITNVLGEHTSSRVRTNKPTAGDWLIKHEIQSNPWASSIMIPFN